MFSHKLLTVVVLLCSVTGALFAQLPSYIKVCKREQSTIDACVRNSINSLRPQLVEGIPELNVPSIEPFFIPELVAISGTDLVPLRASGKNVRVTGAGNFTIKSVSLDIDSLTIKAKVRFPHLHFDGQYKVDTRILVLPINGQGNLVADAVKCDADLLLKSQVTTRDGKEYLKFTSMDIDIAIKDYRIRLEGLFNGDKVLGEATNAAIHENRGEFLKTMKPYLERTVSKILLDSANKIVKGLPLDDLLPKP
ncbi:protein takeout-like [Epargyreus clarus]|uniref:protein takeout-like n=1 Tax=Epargyreus clarus TaxID=520877 RepID=UPI003C2F8AB9